MERMTTRRNVTFVFGGAAVAAVLIGLGAAGAIAASGAWSPSEERKAVIEDAARQLGVEPDALSDALKQALENRIDAAVEAGRITEEQANALKERLESGGDVPLPGGFGPHFGHVGAHLGHLGHVGSLEAAAEYLGLTAAELRERLEDATLAEIAQDRGKSVDGLTKALVTAAESKIDEAVAAGRLTQEQAAVLKAALPDRVEALVNGEHRGPGRDFRPGLWPGGISPRGPPDFEGPRA
jgi:NADH dehydrogenase/NADH:ubiquinone oxidoreductase subunit G